MSRCLTCGNNARLDPTGEHVWICACTPRNIEHKPDSWEDPVSLLNIKLLQRYRVDRHAGMTADGSTQLVVLVVKASDAHELAVAMSKADAMILGTQLVQAAGEASEHMARG